VKLVRDRIPEIIVQTGKSCSARRVHDHHEFSTVLHQKIIEESEEFLLEPCVEEAADIYEVFKSLIKLNDIELSDVIAAAAEKKAERGGFDRGVLLIVVED
jgi:predicted house-cleaning noncanonical NTP pyrophosphatase (MazG superfamily)